MKVPITLEIVMALNKDFQKTMVMSGYDRHRQNGGGSVSPKGTIVDPSYKGWTVASIALVLLTFGFVFFPNDFVSLVQWALGIR